MGAHQERGLLLYQQDRYQQALDEFQRELAEEPESSRAHSMSAACLIGMERLKDATRFAREAIALDPEDAFAHYVMARVYDQRNRDKEARRAIDEAIRLDPEEPEYRAVLASLHAQLEDWRAALAAADDGLALDPECVSCQNLRAMALGRLGRKRERGESLESAFAAQPENPTTHANQGWAHLEAGRIDDALASFREALRLDPHHEWAREGVVNALKARNPVFRVLLAYFFWMSRLSPRARWGVILGALFGHRILRAVARDNPQLSPILTPIGLLYLLFVFLTWTADPLFNLLLFLNRDGRRVLVQGERIAAGLMCLVLVIAAGLAIPAWSDGTFASWGAVAAFGLLAIPLSAAASAPEGWPRAVMAGITSILAFLAAMGVMMRYFVPGELSAERATGFYALAIVGSMLSTWIASFVVHARVRR